MGLVSPGGQNLDFLELWQVLSTYDGDLRDPLWWPQEMRVPMRVARGLLGIPLLSMPQPKSFCGVGPGTLGFPPVLTWIFGYVWSLPRGVSPRLKSGHARALSSRLYQQCHASHRLDEGICIFPSRLSHEVFSRGYPTGLSHVPPWWESILSVKVAANSGEARTGNVTFQDKEKTLTKTFTVNQSRRGLTPLGRLQTYSKIHVSTGEES